MLVLFGPENYDSIYNTIRYLISQKGRITYVVSHNFCKDQSRFNYSSPLEKTLT